jgi:hypothetical protein
MSTDKLFTIYPTSTYIKSFITHGKFHKVFHTLVAKMAITELTIIVTGTMMYQVLNAQIHIKVQILELKCKYPGQNKHLNLMTRYNLSRRICPWALRFTATLANFCLAHEINQEYTIILQRELTRG